MPPSSLEILYEDNHLLVVNKPVGLPTMGVATYNRSLIGLAKKYIKDRYVKPGNVYLGVVSRLDAQTSGVVVLARTSKAAARLTRQFRDRQVSKTYWAIVAKAMEPRRGEWIDWLAKNEEQERMVLCRPEQPGAKEARLRYRELRKLARGCLVEIDLVTGRKHQIRVQFAARGFPICGERKYGRGIDFPSGIALHARRLIVSHPVRHETLELLAPLPHAWKAWGVADT